MQVLVTAASKHGATAEIAGAIGSALEERGVAATVSPPDEVEGIDGFDAVVLGSAVYAGHWLKPALEFVDRFADALGAGRVWLFSSGPLGDPPKPDEDPVDVEAVASRVGPEEHRVFAGRLERARLGFGERAIVAALRAPEGDFRDWDAIEEWAGTIADRLLAPRIDQVG